METTQAGWIKRYLYYNMSGTAVTNLLNGTNDFGVLVFPDSPDTTELIPTDPSYSPDLAESLSGMGNNYGSYTPGYIEPPETGQYTFWVCGDDETQLWLTTDASDPLNPAKKQRIAMVPGWSNARDWTKYPEQQSAPVTLEKGKQYYLEVLHKQGTGGDNIGWGWQLPSGTLDRPLRTFYLQPTLATNATVVDGVYAVPFVTRADQDYSIYDGMEVMLYANLNLTPPYAVQWLRGVTEIPGANQTYYRFRARNSDNGAQFSIRVNGTTYGPVTLSVNPDTEAPALVSAAVDPANPKQIQIVFSEWITPNTATNTANYTLDTATVLDAQLQSDGRSVLLKTTLLDATRPNILTIRGMQDFATPANTMADTQTTLLIIDGTLSFRYWDKTFAANLASLRAWSCGTNLPAPSYLTNGFDEERTITTTSYQWNLAPARDNYMGQMIGYLTPPETGYYRFAIASDDHSILYLGTTDQRSSKREICYYNGSTGRWNTGAQLANQRSAMIYLEAGKTYYLEAVYRDGTGGDGVSVFWQTPSGPALPTVNQSVQASTEPFLIPIQYLSTFATPAVPGALTFRIWYSSFATDLGSLTVWSTDGNSAYENDQFVEEMKITTTSYPWNLTPVMNNCMGQMIGYLTPPETGNYKFAVASDDHSILYLGTNDLRSSKREICNYNGATGRWNVGAQVANQQSALIPLEAGKRYYIEAVFRDGTGGDGVSVFWQTPSGTALPTANESVQANTEPFLIPTNYLSSYSTFGNVFLKNDLPAAFSAAESTRPTLSVVADGTKPYAYQWY